MDRLENGQDPPRAEFVTHAQRPRRIAEPRANRQVDVGRLGDPLLSDLLRRGIASADPSGLGLRVDGDYRLIGKGQLVSSILSLTGPLLKGEFWEATAVPELRVHAGRLAERLSNELSLVALA